MAFTPSNNTGQATMANSAPVVLASDHSNVPTSINASIFKFSTNNTTTAEIAAGASFTGTIETALDQPSISLLMTSDQPITLTIRQFLDAGGVYAVPNIVYYVPAGQGFSGSFTLNGNYIQVIATNTGTVSTTGFELNTAYGNLPSSDATGRLPISVADCVQVLTATTISTVTSSPTIDTQGFQAVVCQVTGQWSGNGLFESSIDNVNWEKCFSLPDGLLVLQDIVTNNGLYIVRPAGRYLRFRTAQITGSLVLRGIGRSSPLMTADQGLSLAMDGANQTPLNININQDSLNKLAPAQNLTLAGEYWQAGVIPINTPLLKIDCSKYASLSIQYSVGTTGVVTPQWSNDGTTWLTATMMDTAGAPATTLAAGSSVRVINVLAKFFRLLLTTATTAGTTSFIVNGTPSSIVMPPIGTQPVSLATNTPTLAAGTNLSNDVGIQYRANATGAALTSKFTAAATANAANIKASAGRLIGWTLSNTTASAKFFRFFNLAVAPTMGTSSPAFVIVLPANSTISQNYEGGISFSTGIAIACTGAVADLDTTVTAANDVIGALFYQ